MYLYVMCVFVDLCTSMQHQLHSLYIKVFEMPPEHIPRTSVSCLGCWWNRTERGPDFGPFGRGLVAALEHILMFGTLQKMQRGWEGVAFLSFWGLLCPEKDDIYIYNILYIYMA